MKIKQIVFNISNKLLPTSIYMIKITKVNSRKTMIYIVFIDKFPLWNNTCIMVLVVRSVWQTICKLSQF